MDKCFTCLRRNRLFDIEEILFFPYLNKKFFISVSKIGLHFIVRIQKAKKLFKIKISNENLDNECFFYYCYLIKIAIKITLQKL